MSEILSTWKQISTLVIGEYEGGSLKPQSVSAVEAAKLLGKDNSISMLLAGSGPSLEEAAANATSCHPSISKVVPYVYHVFHGSCICHIDSVYSPSWH